MKKLGFEQQGTITYLVYEFEPEDVVDSMSLGMLMNNQIPGFAQLLFTQIDERRHLKYNVTARVSADQYLQGTVNRKRLTGVLRGIVTAMLAAEEYMIDPNTIQFELSSIFSNVVTSETVVICVPTLSQNTLPKDPLTFFKDIVFGTQYDPQEDQNYVGRILSYLNGTREFSASEFKGILDYLAAEARSPIQQPTLPVSPPQLAPVVQQPVLPDPPQPELPSPADKLAVKTEDRISLFYLLQHYNKDNAAIYKAQKEEKKAEKQQKKAAKIADKKRKKELNKNAVPSAGPGFSVPGLEPVQTSDAAARETPPVQPVQPTQPTQPLQLVPQAPPYYQPYQQYQTPQSDDTTYYSEEDEDGTVIMGLEKQTQRMLPHLVRKRNNERIPLNKEIFRLGRDADYNDYAIIENRYIGHSHCHIICRDGEYFVVDDNSKNHTKVNQEQIIPSQEKKIAHGDIISLADEDFEFKLF